MSLLYPIISIICFAFGKVSDKYNFNKYKIKPTQEIFIVFLIMLIGIGPIVIFFNKSTILLNLHLILLLIILIIISFLQNLFEFKGLNLKDLSFREPIYNLQPMLTSFIAYIFFPSEREIKFIIGIVLGTIILYLGSFHIKGKFKIDKGTLYILLSVIFASILSNIYKLGLEKTSPEFLLLFRVMGVLLLLLFFKQVKFEKMNNNKVSFGILAGIFYLIALLTNLYSIKYLGLNLTIMFLLMGPGLTYLLSHFILKEKISIRRIVTSLMLICLIFVISIV